MERGPDWFEMQTVAKHFVYKALFPLQNMEKEGIRLANTRRRKTAACGLHGVNFIISMSDWENVFYSDVFIFPTDTY